MEPNNDEREIYYCDLCEQAYKNAVGLKVHVCRLKPKAKHVCPFCPSRFTRAGSLTKHLNDVCKNKPKEVPLDDVVDERRQRNEIEEGAVVAPNKIRAAIDVDVVDEPKNGIWDPKSVWSCDISIDREFYIEHEKIYLWGSERQK
jgi:hypothetical protein